MPAIRPVHYQKLVAVFSKDGFVFNRQKGSHLIYIKPGSKKRPLVIPTYHAVPVSIIKGLLESAGMTRERYFELLEG